MKKLMVFLFILLLGVGKSYGGELTLSWDAIADASGYKVVYGTSYDSLDQEIDVGQAEDAGLPNPSCPLKKKYTVANLQIGTLYFFKIKGYSGSTESDLSNGVYGYAKIKTPSLTVQ